MTRNKETRQKAPDINTLSGVPQTMLWTLYHRAAESLRDDGILKDPLAEQLYAQIDFDFFLHFGVPDGGIAARAKMFDDVVLEWLSQNPEGTVVELGCGLETQCQRIHSPSAHWVFVDLPESLAWRQRLITDPPHSTHISGDCFALQWLETLKANQPVLVSAQGLLMYFPEHQVRTLLREISRYFDQVDLLFDVLPLWASLWTTSPVGLWRTPFYRVPAMPWGIAPSQVGNVLQSWIEKPVTTQWHPIQMIRSYTHGWLDWMGHMPLLQDPLPAVVHAQVRPQSHR